MFISCAVPDIEMNALLILVAQVDEMLRGAPVNTQGQFDYCEFTKILKRGQKEETE
jgi:Ca2+-binding EF-hand superfamily protein